MSEYAAGPTGLVPNPPAESVVAVLNAAGLSLTSTDVTVRESPLSIVLPSGVTLGFVQQLAMDGAAEGWGFRPASYPMTATASSATAAVSSTVTITADTGDASYTGPVEFYIGGTLQATETAVAGKASCGITSASSGTVAVYAWVPAYGYDSASVTFQ